MMANGKITLKYKEKLSWLEEYSNDTPARQLTLDLYAEKLQKLSMSESKWNDMVVESMKMRAKESIEKTEKGCEKLTCLLTTCEYYVGTLQDAISQKKVIFFNYGKSKTQKYTIRLIKENSDLDMEFEVKRNDYYEVIETLPERSYFYYFQQQPLPALRNMHKLSMWNSSSGERW